MAHIESPQSRTNRRVNLDFQATENQVVQFCQPTTDLLNLFHAHQASLQSVALFTFSSVSFSFILFKYIISLDFVDTVLHMDYSAWDTWKTNWNSVVQVTQSLEDH